LFLNGLLAEIFTKQRFLFKFDTVDLLTIMLLEIHGTGTRNKGAELMALAIAMQLRGTSPNIKLAVGSEFGPYGSRGKYGFFRTNDFRSAFRGWVFDRLSSDKLLNEIGFARMAEASAVLDASGFAFSDQLGPGPAIRLWNKMHKSSRRRQKLILLPQAFGPFQDPKVVSACRRILERADLVYARDRDSLEAVRQFTSAEKLRLCPDFTVALHGKAADNLELPSRFAAIVPNVRMIDKTSDQDGSKYFTFIESAAAAIKQVDLKPVFVLHEGAEDQELLPKLFAHTGRLPVFHSDDPLLLKGVLGRANVVVGSRFHALVSSLSQGVPCIGAGWSHKYYWLFDDFGCAENLVRDLSSLDELKNAVSRTCLEPQRGRLTDRIKHRAKTIRERVEEMWREVEATVGIEPQQTEWLEDGHAGGNG
jgi:polysaccharide pyruvyl transferase WcaK-like protein